MQLIMLGSPYSGLSDIASIINKMGVYFDTQIVANTWEKEEIRRLHDDLLISQGAQWDNPGKFDLTALHESSFIDFERRATRLIQQLDSHRPWAISSSTLCLMLPLWQKLLECPIYLHVYRDPRQICTLLEARAHIPAKFGLALWEKYTVSALTHTWGAPQILISYDALLQDPENTSQQLYKQLMSLGMTGLEPLPKQETFDKLHVRNGALSTLSEIKLTAQQNELMQLLSDNRLDELEQPPKLSQQSSRLLRQGNKSNAPLHISPEAAENNAIFAVTIVLHVDNAKVDKTELISRLQQSTALPFELFIINNGVSPAEKLLLPSDTFLRTQVNFIENMPYSHVIRQIAQLPITSQYIALLDANIKVSENWLEKLTYVLEQYDDTDIVNAITLQTGRDQDLRSALAEQDYPRVDAINLQCCLIRKERVDELSMQASLTTRIADDCYVTTTGRTEPALNQTTQLSAFSRYIKQLQKYDLAIGFMLQENQEILENTLNIANVLVKLKKKVFFILEKEAAYCLDKITFDKRISIIFQEENFPEQIAHLDILFVSDGKALNTLKSVSLFPDKPLLLACTENIFPKFIELEQDRMIGVEPFQPIMTDNKKQLVKRWEAISAAYLYRFIPPKISIIILVRNQTSLTWQCLQTLRQYTRYKNYEILIVDNDSNQETKKVLARASEVDERIKIITNTENLSFSEGNNQAAAVAEGELLLLLNNDMEFFQWDWLDKLVLTLLNNNMVAATGPRLLYPGADEVQSSGVQLHINHRTHSLEDAKENQDAAPSGYEYALTAACLLVWRDIYYEVQELDPRYIYGQEDVDFCLKLSAHGYKLYHCAESLVMHYGSLTRRATPQSQKNRTAIRQKWAGRVFNL